MSKYCVKTLLLISSVCCGCCFGETLRDPTQPLDYSRDGDSSGDLQLHSILIGPTRRIAIINGKSLKEGEPFPGRENLILKKIEAGRVLVSDDGQLRVLLLSEPLK